MAGKLVSPRALRLHLTLVVLLPAFAFMFWWQLHRALGGNELSWAYTVEWPLFACYAVFLWWRLLNEDAPRRPRRQRGRDDGARAAREEAERAAYNRYLAGLAEEERKGEQR